MPRPDCAGEGEEVISVIVAAATTAATAEGLDHRAAHRLAAAITDRLRRELGTLRVYIPAPSRAARDRAILAGLAAGDSRQAIASRVGVDVKTVYRVERRRQQQNLRERTGLATADWLL